MKEDAIKRTHAGLDPERKNEAYELQDYIGAVALAYILDQEDAALHANTVRNVLLQNYSRIRIEESSNWGTVVPPMSSFFVAILALDIVYNSLSSEDIRLCEEVIISQIFKINRKGSWGDVRSGTHGVWDIYQGERTSPDEDYYNNIMRQITEDGVSPVTIHYAWERVGGGDSTMSLS